MRAGRGKGPAQRARVPRPCPARRDAAVRSGPRENPKTTVARIRRERPIRIRRPSPVRCQRRGRSRAHNRTDLMPPVDRPTHSRRQDFRCWLPRAQALIAEAEAIRNGQPNPTRSRDLIDPSRDPGAGLARAEADCRLVGIRLPASSGKRAIGRPLTVSPAPPAILPACTMWCAPSSKLPSACLVHIMPAR
jgi:hypothetical protein